MRSSFCNNDLKSNCVGCSMSFADDKADDRADAQLANNLVVCIVNAQR
jgi:hypothetical protein